MPLYKSDVFDSTLGLEGEGHSARNGGQPMASRKSKKFAPLIPAIAPLVGPIVKVIRGALPGSRNRSMIQGKQTVRNRSARNQLPYGANNRDSARTTGRLQRVSVDVDSNRSQWITTNRWRESSAPKSKAVSQANARALVQQLMYPSLLSGMRLPTVCSPGTVTKSGRNTFTMNGFNGTGSPSYPCNSAVIVRPFAANQYLKLTGLATAAETWASFDALEIGGLQSNAVNWRCLGFNVEVMSLLATGNTGNTGTLNATNYMFSGSDFTSLTVGNSFLDKARLTPGVFSTSLLGSAIDPLVCTWRPMSFSPSPTYDNNGQVGGDFSPCEPTGFTPRFEVTTSQTPPFIGCDNNILIWVDANASGDAIVRVMIESHWEVFMDENTYFDPEYAYGTQNDLEEAGAAMKFNIGPASTMYKGAQRVNQQTSTGETILGGSGGVTSAIKLQRVANTCGVPVADVENGLRELMDEVADEKNLQEKKRHSRLRAELLASPSASDASWDDLDYKSFLKSRSERKECDAKSSSSFRSGGK